MATSGTVRPNAVNTIWPAAFRTIETARIPASTRNQRGRLRAKGASRNSHGTPGQRPISRSSNSNVGIGHQPGRSRNAMTVELETARNPVGASSNTGNAAAARKQTHWRTDGAPT